MTNKLLNKIALAALLLGSASTGFADSESDSSNTGDYSKFRFGGYGEILYQHMDYGADRYNPPGGAEPDSRAHISMPRAVFAFQYKFTPSIEFSTEIEFEHGGTGSALELEYEEMGEYEMEMEHAGEVVLEELKITKTFSRAFRLSAGHMIVPIGATNANHLPIQFFGTVRPEGETTIIPLTWHETGIGISGDIKHWSYQAQIVNGLDANGFSSAYWVRKGKQGIFEDTKMTNPAYTVRIENSSIRHLTIGASAYYGKSTGNTAKPAKMEHLDGAVSIASANFAFNNKKIIVRGNAIYGNLSDAYEIGTINKTISKNIQYPRTPVATNALTYSAEAGFDVLSFWNRKEKLFPFVRYEYYNSMEAADEETFLDPRHKRTVITAGLNFFPLPNLVIKADYARRIIDSGNLNSENTIGLALAYTGWFISK